MTPEHVKHYVFLQQIWTGKINNGTGQVVYTMNEMSTVFQDLWSTGSLGEVGCTEQTGLLFDSVLKYTW